MIVVKHADFVLNRLKEKPAIAWIGRHPIDIGAVIILIAGAYFLIPMIMNMPAPAPVVYNSPVAVIPQAYCQIGHVYINIVISDDGITYLNDKYKVSVYLNNLGITDDLKGPYLDLPAIDSTINVTAVPYDSNYVTLTKSMRVGCVSDIHISMMPIKKDPNWKDKEAVVVDTNWQTSGFVDSNMYTIAVIDYNKDIYYVS